MDSSDLTREAALGAPPVTWPDGISVHVVIEGETELFERLFADVFRPSFEEVELPVASYVCPQSHRLVGAAIDADGSPVAGVVLDWEPDLQPVLLSYIAVRPDRRSERLGALLLDATIEELARTSGERRPIIAEVRNPLFFPDQQAAENRARLRFYIREGWRCLDEPWIQPGLSGQDREDGLLLLVRDADNGFNNPHLVEWARRYFIASEGQEPQDQLYRDVLSGLDRARVMEIPPELVAAPQDERRP